MDALSWSAVLKSLVFWGPGAVMAGFIIFALYKIAVKVGLKFVDAVNEASRALASQAESMRGLKDSVDGFVTKDNSEHREMLVLLRFIAQQQQAFEEVRLEHRERKEQTHPHCPVKPA